MHHTHPFVGRVDIRIAASMSGAPVLLQSARTCASFGTVRALESTCCLKVIGHCPRRPQAHRACAQLGCSNAVVSQIAGIATKGQVKSAGRFSRLCHFCQLPRRVLTAMREASDCFLNPVPPDLTLVDLRQELIDYFHLPAWKVEAWLGALCPEQHTSTCAHLLMIDIDRVNTAFETASLTMQEVSNIKIALGTPLFPFAFPPPDVNAFTDTDVPVKKKKGGATTESSQVLPARRPPIIQYFPPVQFDAHRRGLITRDEKELMKLVVQEVCTRAHVVPATHTCWPSHKLLTPCPWRFGCRFWTCAVTYTRPLKSG
jgi:hypothetical protein